MSWCAYIPSISVRKQKARGVAGHVNINAILVVWSIVIDTDAWTWKNNTPILMLYCLPICSHTPCVIAKMYVSYLLLQCCTVCSHHIFISFPMSWPAINWLVSWATPLLTHMEGSSGSCNLLSLSGHHYPGPDLGGVHTPPFDFKACNCVSLSNSLVKDSYMIYSGEAGRLVIISGSKRKRHPTNTKWVWLWVWTPPFPKS